MNDLKNNIDDVAIDENMTAWVSQRKLAEMCGVSNVAIHKHISQVNTFNYNKNNDVSLKNDYLVNTSNQLDAKSANLVLAHYARQKKAQAIETLALISEAGMTAYLYKLAGLTIEISHKKIELEKPIRSLDNRQFNVYLPNDNSKEAQDARAKTMAIFSFISDPKDHKKLA